MIRFSASLVIVAIGLLAAGVVTSQLALVYLAIAVGVVALIALVIGAVLKRGELFGQSAQDAPGGVTGPGFAASREAVPVAAGTVAGPDRERSARVGYGPAPGDEPPYRDDAEPRHRDNAAHHDRPAYRDGIGYKPAASDWTGYQEPDRAGYQETGDHMREFYYSGRGGFAGPGGGQAGGGAAGGVAPSQSLAEGHGGPAEDTAERGPDSPASAERPAASAEADGAGPGEGAGPSKSTGPAESAASAEQTVIVVPGVPRYHRAECILIRFMGEDDLEQTPLEAAREAGCTPCRACQPDGKAAV